MRIMIFIAILLMVFVSFAEAGEILNQNCTNDGAVVVVMNPSGAKYLGATATLANGKYYDFPVVEIGMTDVGRSVPFNLTGNYKASSFEARLWGKKKKSKNPWSDKVVNHLGYVMEKPASSSVICTP